MPIAALSTGGHSTLDVVLGIAILLWALASVTALLGWLSRLARRHRNPAAAGRSRPSALARVRRDPLAGSDPALGSIASAPAAMTAGEQDADRTSPESLWASTRPGATDRSCQTAASRPPALPGPRCSPETLEPLAQSFEVSHRLQVAEALVAETLAALPSDRWLVERYVLIAGHRIPFLVAGETGVLTIWALTGPPLWDELSIPAHVASHVAETLPGYTAPIRVGICRALAAESVEPRWWCRASEPGAWVMGLDWLIRWIEHFGREHGLGITDLKRLRELSQPKPGPAARVPDVVPDLR